MAEGEATTEYQVEYGDSPVYRWTIRTLYALAIGMNVYIMWQASRDDVEMAILKSKATAWVKQVTRPFTVHREWQKSLNRMHFDAVQTLEGAAPDA
jgi:hypothetical protein